ncbi:MAG: hypothetical protein WHS38_06840 [Thermodesulforhabdaceae bacterium]
MAREGEVVLVYVENQPAFFARIESITPDVKPGWFQVRMLVLQLPMIVVTWILREAYINGDEFTMGGRPIRITPVVAPPAELWDEEDEKEEREIEEVETEKDEIMESENTGDKGEKGKTRKVISLADRKKKKTT